MTSTDTTTTTDTDEPTFEKGTWQFTLHQSSVIKKRGADAQKKAGALLWTGAQSAIEGWLPNSEDDVSGEDLQREVTTALGKERKGDASKIKTVAVAVKDKGLVLSAYPSLTKAYAEARRLTQVVAQEADEDDAAEKAVESITAPSSTTTVDGAAQILLSKGIDGAWVAILDALGATNEQAHRAFLRAGTVEISARVQANKPKPAPKAPATAKGAAKPSTGSSPKAAVKTAGTKAKPVSKSKGDPNKRALPTKKAAPVAKQADKGTPVSEPVEAGLADATETQTSVVSTPDVPVRSAQTKAKPVVIKR